MGLDWHPGNKPKPGHETEYNEIVQKLAGNGERNSGSLKRRLLGLFNKSRERRDREDLMERFFEISISAYETLQAPRVGYDETANEWARSTYAERQPDMSEQEWLDELKGYYVLDLLPPCDGLPRYSNSPLGLVERYSFRGQFLADCQDVIGDDLFQRAYENMTSSELMDYGRELTRIAEDCAENHEVDLETLSVGDPEEIHSKPDIVVEGSRIIPGQEIEGIESKIDILLAAGRWCTFWAERGHILDVDY